MADRFVKQDAGPAGAEQHGHLARGRIDGFEIYQRLGQRLVNRAIPGVRGDDGRVEVAPADADAAGFAASVCLYHDRDVQSGKRADVGGDEAVGTDDFDHAPRSQQRHRYLRHAGIAGAGGGVDRFAQRDLVGERHQLDRVGSGIEVAVVAARRGGAGAVAGVDQRHRLRRAADRIGG